MVINRRLSRYRFILVTWYDKHNLHSDILIRFLVGTQRVDKHLFEVNQTEAHTRTNPFG